MTREEAEQVLCNRAWTPTAATIEGRLGDLKAAALAYAKACGYVRCWFCRDTGTVSQLMMRDGEQSESKVPCPDCRGTGEELKP